MGQILIPGGGNSADLDMITATPGDVLAPKVTVDREGEPVTGTLALTGNTAAADVRRGKTFYSTDAKSRQTGTMAEKGAATYTPGRSNQVIAANQFLAGAQTIRGDANLLADNILYGKSIFGVSGNVRKHGYYYGQSSTAGSKNFNLNSGGTVSLPYLSFSPGFTPVICLAQKNGETTISISTPWNHISVRSDNGRSYSVTITGLMNAGNTIFPVYAGGGYQVWLAGYY